jgi:lactosylceramide 4-alpha-galactosyltransferase
VTDLFRQVAPWKYGGFYLDTDFLVVRPIAHLRNTLVWETPTQINNAFSVFDASHPFLAAMMQRAKETYHPDLWTSLGPKLVTDTKKEWGNKLCPGQQCITVLPPVAAFGVKFQDAAEVLMSPLPTKICHPYRGSMHGVLAVHYFNKVTAPHPLRNTSLLYSMYQRNCVSCRLHP